MSDTTEPKDDFEGLLGPRSTGDRPRLDKMTGFKAGPCTVCGKGAERTRVFTGKDATYENLKAWENLPMVHKRCEEDLAIKTALEAEKESKP